MLKPIHLLAVLFVAAALLSVTGRPLLEVSAALREPSAAAPGLGEAVSYSVLGGSTVTNTGPTTVYGDLGVYPGSAVTGDPNVGPPGTIHAADAHAAAAQAANASAFGSLDQPCDVTYEGVKDLTLVSPLEPGVYCAVSFALSGDLVLSGSGVWIFKSASTLITSPGSAVSGSDACNVWWRVGSSATLGTGSDFIGNILASTSIGMDSGASLTGRALAQTGAVTLANNTILGCISTPTNTPTVTATSQPDTPTATATVQTGTPTATATATVQTGTPTATATATVQTGTPTATATATVQTGTPTATATVQTGTPTATATVQTGTPTATATATVQTGTPTATATATVQTGTPTATATATPPPTAVELLYFVMSRNGQTVELKWATEEEVDNYGFNLYRAPVNDFSQAQLIHFEPSAIEGGTGSGATYRYLDIPPVQGTWWYWLTDIDTHGVETLFFDPAVAIAIELHFEIYLPRIGKH